MEIALTKDLDEVLPPTVRQISFDAIKTVMVTEDQYWQQASQRGRIVEPLKRPCGDCAITTGYYVEHAESLSKQPQQIQDAVLDRWFCHNNCNRACKGVREFLETK